MRNMRSRLQLPSGADLFLKPDAPFTPLLLATLLRVEMVSVEVMNGVVLTGTGCLPSLKLLSLYTHGLILSSLQPLSVSSLFVFFVCLKISTSPWHILS